MDNILDKIFRYDCGGSFKLLWTPNQNTISIVRATLRTIYQEDNKSWIMHLNSRE